MWHMTRGTAVVSEAHIFQKPQFPSAQMLTTSPLMLLWICIEQVSTSGPTHIQDVSFTIVNLRRAMYDVLHCPILIHQSIL